MESKTNYTVVGIIVLFLAAALVSSLLWLSIGFDTKKYKQYLVYMTEPANGLSDDSVVKFNGVKVGVVSNIQLNKQDPQKIILLLNIEEDVLITTSTRATMVTQGITGTTYLSLITLSSTLAPLKKKPNEPYPVIPYNRSFFHQLETNFAEISKNINRILNKENAKHVKTTLQNLDQITTTFAQNKQNINQSLESLPQVLTELKTAINRIATAGQQMTKTMRAGEHGMDQINLQTLPLFNSLLQRLNEVSTNLDQVSRLMTQNPSVIIRGTAPATSGPGE